MTRDSIVIPTWYDLVLPLKYGVSLSSSGGNAEDLEAAEDRLTSVGSVHMARARDVYQRSAASAIAGGVPPSLAVGQGRRYSSIRVRAGYCTVMTPSYQS